MISDISDDEEISRFLLAICVSLIILTSSILFIILDRAGVADPNMNVLGLNIVAILFFTLLLLGWDYY